MRAKSFRGTPFSVQVCTNSQLETSFTEPALVGSAVEVLLRLLRGFLPLTPSPSKSPDLLNEPSANLPFLTHQQLAGFAKYLRQFEA